MGVSSACFLVTFLLVPTAHCSPLSGPCCCFLLWPLPLLTTLTIAITIAHRHPSPHHPPPAARRLSLPHLGLHTNIQHTCTHHWACSCWNFWCRAFGMHFLSIRAPFILNSNVFDDGKYMISRMKILTPVQLTSSSLGTTTSSSMDQDRSLVELGVLSLEDLNRT
jgi:hypothetical protein